MLGRLTLEIIGKWIIFGVIVLAGCFAGYGMKQLYNRSDRIVLEQLQAEKIASCQLRVYEIELRYPWIQMARARMTELERLEFDALAERITQRKEKK